ncbi:hypothetical protein ACIRVN_14800 [Streptomyces albogriseolus]|uniref:hypothetical protein n=1 Tax=Streptomyces albogriseolus TaxID=1887 RepID=UPI0038185218
MRVTSSSSSVAYGISTFHPFPDHACRVGARHAWTGERVPPSVTDGDIEGKRANTVQRVFAADDATDRHDAPAARKDS